MNIKYIPFYLKHFPFFKKLTAEEKGKFLEMEIEYIENGTKPVFNNVWQEVLHVSIWGEMTEISRDKEEKKQYDAERYKNKKKNEKMNG